MSADPRTLTGDAASRDDDTPALFSSGTRVGVEQMGIVSGELGAHSMGHGELVTAPQLGSTLELRIRGARGLASSRIRALEAPEHGYLLVATERSVYLVALPELSSHAYPESVSSAAVAMVRRIQEPENIGDEVTQYVRLELDCEPGDSVLPRGPVFASVERADAAVSKEALGQCELLSAVVAGSPLRFATADGRVLATSDVTSISQAGLGEFRVATGNSIYLLAPVVPTTE